MQWQLYRENVKIPLLKAQPFKRTRKSSNGKTFQTQNVLSQFTCRTCRFGKLKKMVGNCWTSSWNLKKLGNSKTTTVLRHGFRNKKAAPLFSSKICWQKKLRPVHRSLQHLLSPPFGRNWGLLEDFWVSDLGEKISLSHDQPQMPKWSMSRFGRKRSCRYVFEDAQPIPRIPPVASEHFTKGEPKNGRLPECTECWVRGAPQDMWNLMGIWCVFFRKDLRNDGNQETCFTQKSKEKETRPAETLQNPVRDHTKIYQEYSGIYQCSYQNSKYIMAWSGSLSFVLLNNHQIRRFDLLRIKMWEKWL